MSLGLIADDQGADPPNVNSYLGLILYLCSHFQSDRQKSVHWGCTSKSQNCCLSFTQKPGSVSTIFTYYRPVFNLLFAKVLEKVALSRLQSHLELNHLYEPLRSGFLTLHCTETALLMVVTDLLLSAESGFLIFPLLNLNSAFDTVFHKILPVCRFALGI